MAISPDMREAVKTIVVEEQGKDAECWAGHYGAQFSSEKVYIEVESDVNEKSLQAKFVVKTGVNCFRAEATRLRASAPSSRMAWVALTS